MIGFLEWFRKKLKGFWAVFPEDIWNELDTRWFR